MQQTYQQVMYFEGGDFLILKLVGTLRFDCAFVLEQALEHLKNTKEDHDIIIDMTDTKYIDSTIIGTIAKSFLPEQGKENLWSLPKIVFEHDDVKKVFDKIGFDKFFNFQKSDARINIPLESFTKIENSAQDKEKLRSTVYSAHQALNTLQPHDEDIKIVVQSLKDK